MFASPLGLLALLGVPVVIALHLFRRRFQPREVSALFLWLDPDRSPAAGRKRDRLHASSSFWFEVLAALLLGLAFAQPKGCAPGEARHLVVVLDDSASMSATTTDGSTLAQRARDRVQALLRDLPNESRVTLLAAGARPETLAGPAALPTEAREALAKWSPRSPSSDAAPALALGAQLAGGAVVQWITDRLPEGAWSSEIGVEAVGEPLANVAIANATRIREEAGDRLLVSVLNAADRPLERDFRIECAGRELIAQRLTLAARETRHLSLALPSGLPTVVAALEGDALSCDDVAVLAPPAPRTLALATRLGETTARRLGLARDGSALAGLLAIVPDSTAAAEPGSAHLIVADDALEPPPGQWSLRVRQDTESDAREDLVGPFLVERAHPLLAGATLEGIVWSRSPNLRLLGEALVRAGDEPLLVFDRRGSGAVIDLNLDPARSSLQRSPDWPILLANLAELRRAELPGPARTNLAVGEDLVVRARAGEAWTLRSPGGEARTLQGRDVLVFEGLDVPGEWQLEAPGARSVPIGVSFLSPMESDLSGLTRGSRDADEALRRATVEAASGLSTWLIALALAFAALDWFVLAPRRHSREGARE